MPRSAQLRIAVFYDGNFFKYVSDYYRHTTPLKARLDFHSIHEFIEEEVALEEEVNGRACQCVERHMFRGRVRAADAHERDNTETFLLGERRFDEVLQRANIDSHELSLVGLGPQGSGRREVGIDVMLALKAHRLAFDGRIDVAALVTGDSDFVPLVRELTALGVRVMILGANLPEASPKPIRTSQWLCSEASYSRLLNEVIDPEGRGSGRHLFLPTTPGRQNDTPRSSSAPGLPEDRNFMGRAEGTIKHLGPGWGFIEPRDGGQHYWFPQDELEGTPFSMLATGQHVRFAPGQNHRGLCARRVEVISPRHSAA